LTFSPNNRSQTLLLILFKDKSGKFYREGNHSNGLYDVRFEWRRECFVVEVAGAARYDPTIFFTDSHVSAGDYNEPEAARGLAAQHRTPIGSSVVLASP
jgi:hypothetical protein